MPTPLNSEGDPPQPITSSPPKGPTNKPSLESSLDSSMWSDLPAPPPIKNPSTKFNSSMDDIFMDFSSDPIAGPSIDPKKFSGSHLIGATRKRGGSLTQPQVIQRKIQLVSDETEIISFKTTQDALLAARDNIMHAYHLTKNRAEQDKLLDLLDIFREYTEKGQLSKASAIITNQIMNLEQATKKIEDKTRDLQSTNSNINQPKPAMKTTATSSKHPQPISFANILASKGESYTPDPQEWTVVGGKKKTGTTQPSNQTQKFILYSFSGCLCQQ